MHFKTMRLILLVDIWFSVCALSNFMKFEIKFRGKAIGSKPQQTHTEILDRLTCAAVCLWNPGCLTFSYNHHQKKCWIYSRHLDHYKDHLNDIEDEHIIIVKTPRVDTGKRCTKNEDCDFTEAACYDGVCLCRLGLYFSPRHGGCLKECAQYGDEMDASYKGAGIRLHNDNPIMLYNLTLSECVQFCVAEKTFTCLTVEWDKGDGHCHASEVGYLDVELADRLPIMSSPGWTFGQRRCK